MNIIIYIVFILFNLFIFKSLLTCPNSRSTGRCLLNTFYHKRPFKRNPSYNIKLLCYTSEHRNGLQVKLNEKNNIKIEKDFAIFLHDTKQSSKSMSIIKVANAYTNETEQNFCVFDYHKYIHDDLYTALKRINKLVKNLCMYIEKLQQNGLKFERLTLIGFGLGAHIAGAIGNRVNGKNNMIIGLDPIKLWEDRKCLKKSDAQWVQIIRTTVEPRIIYKQYGHQDFFANGGNIPQPGCVNPSSLAEHLENKRICSHNQAMEYFQSSLHRTHHFVGTKCKNYNHFLRKKCENNEKDRFGIYASKLVTGIFYFKTTNEYPFCKEFNETKQISSTIQTNINKVKQINTTETATITSTSGNSITVKATSQTKPPICGITELIKSTTNRAKRSTATPKRINISRKTTARISSGQTKKVSNCKKNTQITTPKIRFSKTTTPSRPTNQMQRTSIVTTECSMTIKTVPSATTINKPISNIITTHRITPTDTLLASNKRTTTVLSDLIITSNNTKPTISTMEITKNITVSVPELTTLLNCVTTSNFEQVISNKTPSTLVSESENKVVFDSVKNYSVIDSEITPQRTTNIVNKLSSTPKTANIIPKKTVTTWSKKSTQSKTLRRTVTNTIKRTTINPKKVSNYQKTTQVTVGRKVSKSTIRITTSRTTHIMEKNSTGIKTNRKTTIVIYTFENATYGSKSTTPSYIDYSPDGYESTLEVPAPLFDYSTIFNLESSTFPNIISTNIPSVTVAETTEYYARTTYTFEISTYGAKSTTPSYIIYSTDLNESTSEVPAISFDYSTIFNFQTSTLENIMLTNIPSVQVLETTQYSIPSTSTIEISTYRAKSTTPSHIDYSTDGYESTLEVPAASFGYSTIFNLVTCTFPNIMPTIIPSIPETTQYYALSKYTIEISTYSSKSTTPSYIDYSPDGYESTLEVPAPLFDYSTIFYLESSSFPNIISTIIPSVTVFETTECKVPSTYTIEISTYRAKSTTPSYIKYSTDLNESFSEVPTTSFDYSTKFNLETSTFANIKSTIIQSITIADTTEYSVPITSALGISTYGAKSTTPSYFQYSTDSNVSTLEVPATSFDYSTIFNLESSTFPNIISTIIQSVTVLETIEYKVPSTYTIEIFTYGAKSTTSSNIKYSTDLNESISEVPTTSFDYSAKFNFETSTFANIMSTIIQSITIADTTEYSLPITSALGISTYGAKSTTPSYIKYSTDLYESISEVPTTSFGYSTKFNFETSTFANIMSTIIQSITIADTTEYSVPITSALGISTYGAKSTTPSYIQYSTDSNVSTLEVPATSFDYSTIFNLESSTFPNIISTIIQSVTVLETIEYKVPSTYTIEISTYGAKSTTSSNIKYSTDLNESISEVPTASFDYSTKFNLETSTFPNIMSTSIQSITIADTTEYSVPITSALGISTYGAKSTTPSYIKYSTDLYESISEVPTTSFDYSTKFNFETSTFANIMSTIIQSITIADTTEYSVPITSALGISTYGAKSTTPSYIQYSTDSNVSTLEVPATSFDYSTIFNLESSTFPNIISTIIQSVTVLETIEYKVPSTYTIEIFTYGAKSTTSSNIKYSTDLNESISEVPTASFDYSAKFNFETSTFANIMSNIIQSITIADTTEYSLPITSALGISKYGAKSTTPSYIQYSTDSYVSTLEVPATSFDYSTIFNLEPSTFPNIISTIIPSVTVPETTEYKVPSTYTIEISTYGAKSTTPSYIKYSTDGYESTSEVIAASFDYSTIFNLVTSTFPNIMPTIIQSIPETTQYYAYNTYTIEISTYGAKSTTPSYIDYSPDGYESTLEVPAPLFDYSTIFYLESSTFPNIISTNIPSVTVAETTEYYARTTYTFEISTYGAKSTTPSYIIYSTDLHESTSEVPAISFDYSTIFNFQTTTLENIMLTNIPSEQVLETTQYSIPSTSTIGISTYGAKSTTPSHIDYSTVGYESTLEVPAASFDYSTILNLEPSTFTNIISTIIPSATVPETTEYKVPSTYTIEISTYGAKSTTPSYIKYSTDGYESTSEVPAASFDYSTIFNLVTSTFPNIMPTIIPSIPETTQYYALSKYTIEISTYGTKSTTPSYIDYSTDGYESTSEVPATSFDYSTIFNLESSTFPNIISTIIQSVTVLETIEYKVPSTYTIEIFTYGAKSTTSSNIKYSTDLNESISEVPTTSFDYSAKFNFETSTFANIMSTIIQSITIADTTEYALPITSALGISKYGAKSTTPSYIQYSTDSYVSTLEVPATSFDYSTIFNLEPSTFPNIISTIIPSVTVPETTEYKVPSTYTIEISTYGAKSTTPSYIKYSTDGYESTSEVIAASFDYSTIFNLVTSTFPNIMPTIIQSIPETTQYYAYNTYTIEISTYSSKSTTPSYIDYSPDGYESTLEVPAPLFDYSTIFYLESSTFPNIISTNIPSVTVAETTEYYARTTYTFEISTYGAKSTTPSYIIYSTDLHESTSEVPAISFDYSTIFNFQTTTLENIMLTNIPSEQVLETTQYSIPSTSTIGISTYGAKSTTPSYIDYSPDGYESTLEVPAPLFDYSTIFYLESSSFPNIISTIIPSVTVFQTTECKVPSTYTIEISTYRAKSTTPSYIKYSTDLNESLSEVPTTSFDYSTKFNLETSTFANIMSTIIQSITIADTTEYSVPITSALGISTYGTKSTTPSYIKYSTDLYESISEVPTTSFDYSTKFNFETSTFANIMSTIIQSITIADTTEYSVPITSALGISIYGAKSTTPSYFQYSTDSNVSTLEVPATSFDYSTIFNLESSTFPNIISTIIQSVTVLETIEYKVPSTYTIEIFTYGAKSTTSSNIKYSTDLNESISEVPTTSFDYSAKFNFETSTFANIMSTIIQSITIADTTEYSLPITSALGISTYGAKSTTPSYIKYSTDLYESISEVPTTSFGYSTKFNFETSTFANIMSTIIQSITIADTTEYSVPITSALGISTYGAKSTTPSYIQYSTDSNVSTLEVPATSFDYSTIFNLESSTFPNIISTIIQSVTVLETIEYKVTSTYTIEISTYGAKSTTSSNIKYSTDLNESISEVPTTSFDYSTKFNLETSTFPNIMSTSIQSITIADTTEYSVPITSALGISTYGAKSTTPSYIKYSTDLYESISEVPTTSFDYSTKFNFETSTFANIMSTIFQSITIADTTEYSVPITSALGISTYGAKSTTPSYIQYSTDSNVSTLEVPATSFDYSTIFNLESSTFPNIISTIIQSVTVLETIEYKVPSTYTIEIFTYGAKSTTSSNIKYSTDLNESISEVPTTSFDYSAKFNFETSTFANIMSNIIQSITIADTTEYSLPITSALGISTYGAKSTTPSYIQYSTDSNVSTLEVPATSFDYSTIFNLESSTFPNIISTIIQSVKVLETIEYKVPSTYTIEIFTYGAKSTTSSNIKYSTDLNESISEVPTTSFDYSAKFNFETSTFANIMSNIIQSITIADTTEYSLPTTSALGISKYGAKSTTPSYIQYSTDSYVSTLEVPATSFDYSTIFNLEPSTFPNIISTIIPSATVPETTEYKVPSTYTIEISTYGAKSTTPSYIKYSTDGYESTSEVPAASFDYSTIFNLVTSTFPNIMPTIIQSIPETTQYYAYNTYTIEISTYSLKSTTPSYIDYSLDGYESTLEVPAPLFDYSTIFYLESSTFPNIISTNIPSVTVAETTEYYARTTYTFEISTYGAKSTTPSHIDYSTDGYESTLEVPAASFDYSTIFNLEPSTFTNIISTIIPSATVPETTEYKVPSTYTIEISTYGAKSTTPSYIKYSTDGYESTSEVPAASFDYSTIFNLVTSTFPNIMPTIIPSLPETTQYYALSKYTIEISTYGTKSTTPSYIDYSTDGYESTSEVPATSFDYSTIFYLESSSLPNIISTIIPSVTVFETTECKVPSTYTNEISTYGAKSTTPSYIKYSTDLNESISEVPTTSFDSSTKFNLETSTFANIISTIIPLITVPDTTEYSVPITSALGISTYGAISTTPSYIQYSTDSYESTPEVPATSFDYSTKFNLESSMFPNIISTIIPSVTVLETTEYKVPSTYTIEIFTYGAKSTTPSYIKYSTDLYESISEVPTTSFDYSAKFNFETSTFANIMSTIIQSITIADTTEYSLPITSALGISTYGAKSTTPSYIKYSTDLYESISEVPTTSFDYSTKFNFETSTFVNIMSTIIPLITVPDTTLYSVPISSALGIFTYGAKSTTSSYSQYSTDLNESISEVPTTSFDYSTKFNLESSTFANIMSTIIPLITVPDTTEYSVPITSALGISTYGAKSTTPSYIDYTPYGYESTLEVPATSFDYSTKFYLESSSLPNITSTIIPLVTVFETTECKVPSTYTTEIFTYGAKSTTPSYIKYSTDLNESISEVPTTSFDYSTIFNFQTSTLENIMSTIIPLLTVPDTTKYSVPITSALEISTYGAKSTTPYFIQYSTDGYESTLEVPATSFDYSTICYLESFSFPNIISTIIPSVTVFETTECKVPSTYTIEISTYRAKSTTPSYIKYSTNLYESISEVPATSFDYSTIFNLESSTFPNIISTIIPSVTVLETIEYKVPSTYTIEISTYVAKSTTSSNIKYSTDLNESISEVRTISFDYSTIFNLESSTFPNIISTIIPLITVPDTTEYSVPITSALGISTYGAISTTPSYIQYSTDSYESTPEVPATSFDYSTKFNLESSMFPNIISTIIPSVTVLETIEYKVPSTYTTEIFTYGAKSTTPSYIKYSTDLYESISEFPTTSFDYSTKFNFETSTFVNIMSTIIPLITVPDTTEYSVPISSALGISTYGAKSTTPSYIQYSTDLNESISEVPTTSFDYSTKFNLETSTFANIMSTIIPLITVPDTTEYSVPITSALGISTYGAKSTTPSYIDYSTDRYESTLEVPAASFDYSTIFNLASSTFLNIISTIISSVTIPETTEYKVPSTYTIEISTYGAKSTTPSYIIYLTDGYESSLEVPATLFGYSTIFNLETFTFGNIMSTIIPPVPETTEYYVLITYTIEMFTYGAKSTTPFSIKYSTDLFESSSEDLSTSFDYSTIFNLKSSTFPNIISTIIPSITVPETTEKNFPSTYTIEISTYIAKSTTPSYIKYSIDGYESTSEVPATYDCFHNILSTLSDCYKYRSVISTTTKTIIQSSISFTSFPLANDLDGFLNSSAIASCVAYQNYNIDSKFFLENEAMKPHYLFFPKLPYVLQRFYVENYTATT